jgi:hypothetical protein
MWRKAGPSSSLAELCERRAPIWTPPKPQCGVTARVTTASVTTTSVATGYQVTACRDNDARSAQRQGMPTCDCQRVRSKTDAPFCDGQGVGTLFSKSAMPVPATKERIGNRCESPIATDHLPIGGHLVTLDLVHVAMLLRPLPSPTIGSVSHNPHDVAAGSDRLNVGVHGSLCPAFDTRTEARRREPHTQESAKRARMPSSSTPCFRHVAMPTSRTPSRAG